MSQKWLDSKAEVDDEIGQNTNFAKLPSAKWPFLYKFTGYLVFTIAQLLALLIYVLVSLARENLRRLRENLKLKILPLVFSFFKKMAGGEYLGFNNSIFLSERDTADRNFALAYFLRENNCFPPPSPDINIPDILDFYFQVEYFFDLIFFGFEVF